MLSENDKQRYSKQIILPEIGEAGQERLSSASVLVIGAGGLGCPVLQYLAAAGIGKIGVVDFDTVDISNLQRQVLYTEKDLNQSKSETAKNKIQEINSVIEVVSLNVKITSENILSVIQPYDIVVDGTDNYETKYLINDACVILDKPLVFGSIYKYQGQLSVFNHHDGPTYRCVFPTPARTDNCNETGVVGVLPGIVGTMMANEVIKIIIGLGEILSGTLLVIDSLTLEISRYYFTAVEENKRVKTLNSNLFYNTD